MTTGMSFVAITMIATFAHAAPTPFARPLPPQNPIRVRVAHATTFTLTGTNVTINDRAYSGFRSFKIQNGKIDGAQVSTVTGASLRLNLKPVPSLLSLEGRNLIATLDLETYLHGVLPAEMPASWPVEALKAQAVAARTFALYRKAQARGKAWDVDSDVSDQMFLSGAETTAKADQAIDDTKGLVLRDKRGALVAAYFHADCGGHTEDAHNVWGTNDSVGTAIDGGCPLNPRANWSLRLTLKQLSAKLGQNLSALDVGAQNESGRVQQVHLAFTDGTGKTMTGSDLRTALGYNDLRSTAFTVARTSDGYVFTGRGYGHGVGLCQWGARQMAKAGRTFREILAHYYPRARLDRNPNLNDEERDGADNKQAAQFHEKSLPRL